MNGRGAAPNNSNKPFAPGRLHVLIIEDEALVSLFLENLLQELGHDIAGVAGSAATAYAIAEREHVDLAVIDIGLRDRDDDGIEVAIKLKREFGIPALLMSGAFETTFAQRLEPAEPLGYLQKPYTQADVEQVLEAICGRMQYRSN